MSKFGSRNTPDHNHTKGDKGCGEVLKRQGAQYGTVVGTDPTYKQTNTIARPRKTRQSRQVTVVHRF